MIEDLLILLASGNREVRIGYTRDNMPIVTVYKDGKMVVTRHDESMRGALLECALTLANSSEMLKRS